MKPFTWLAMLRGLNALLRQIHGAAYQKSYRYVYEGGRSRKRRAYRIPCVQELELALAEPAVVVRMRA